jgi:hypothetical protein
MKRTIAIVTLCGVLLALAGLGLAVTLLGPADGPARPPAVKSVTPDPGR